MFNSNPKIKFEHELSYNILLEGSKNEAIKAVLQDVAHVMRVNILKPLLESANRVDDFNKLEPNFQKAISFLMGQNNQRRQYAGFLTAFNDEMEITSDIVKVRDFLQTIDNAMSNIQHITDNEKLTQVVKAISEIGYVYVEFFKNKHSDDYQTIYDLLWPTPGEIKVRLSPKELGKQPYLSIAYGIGREKGEIIPEAEAKEGEGFQSGKIAFLMVDDEQRLRLMANEYNSIFSDKNKDSRAKKINIFLEDCQTNFGSPLTEEFKKYSGDVTKKFNFAEWASKIEPASIRLIRSVGAPLVASISGSMARTLIALEDLHGFDDENGLFCPAKAQLVANFVMAYFGRAGHHSAEEVIESYRRLLDYILLHPKRKPLPEQKPEEVPDRTPLEFKQQIESSIQSADFNKRIDASIQDGSAIEARIGYPKAGDFHSFLHDELKKLLPESQLSNKRKHYTI